jgi:hypothetical protein
MPATRKRQQQVHGNRARAALPVSGQLRAQHRRGHDAELTQATRLRYRHSQPGPREATTEPSTNDRVLQPEALAKTHAIDPDASDSGQDEALAINERTD